jgi:4-oxalocrotonate tautomerase family enzyme
MPYIDIRLTAEPTHAQRDALLARTTTLMERLMGKRREVTVVSIAEFPKSNWAVSGSALRQSNVPGAYVEIKVTLGTNTAAEKATMIAATTAMLKEVMGDVQTASYVVIHEVPANAWGYDGLSQAQRGTRKPQTLRQMAGLQPHAAIDPAACALLLIDFQMEYFTGALPIPDGERAVANAARLLDWADDCSMAVVHVQHINAENSAVFPANSARIAFHPALPPKPRHAHIVKNLPSAFVNTDLDDWLKARKLSTVIICGLMTHTCVASTARDALSLGYQSLVVSDACATRDLPSFDDGIVTHIELHRASLAALADRFAEVTDCAVLMGLALRP